MKRHLFIVLTFLCTQVWSQTEMHGWRIHYAYNDVTSIEQNENRVYALSDGALFYTEKETESIERCDKLMGLNDVNIVQMRYSEDIHGLLLLYADGNIDILYDDNSVYNIPDLYNAQINMSKRANSIYLHEGRAYISMDFGILVLNLRRKEIQDTYYIGNKASKVKVHSICIAGDSIYAVSSDSIYTAKLDDNLVDYANWKTLKGLSGHGEIAQIIVFNDQLCLLRDGILYTREQNRWVAYSAIDKINSIKTNGNKLYALTTQSVYEIDENMTASAFPVFIGATDVTYDALNKTYWFAYYADGVGKYDTRDMSVNHYIPSGPINNSAYRIRVKENRVFIVPGGYLSVYYNRSGSVSIYDSSEWTNFSQTYLMEKTGVYTEDYSDVICLNGDPAHFFVASFGYGLIEFRDNEFYARYNQLNSPLVPQIDQPEKYTWVDALAVDANNNLWMYNKATDGVKVLTSNGKWYSIENAATNQLSRCKNLLIWNKNENVKILNSARAAAGIGIFDDNGTLDNSRDDKGVFHSTFTDQDGNELTPDLILSIAQDKSGALWVGTNSGILTFENPESLFSSNACTRIKIRRNDGTNLADYLLNDESINAIAVDGANRKWIGTASSGLYLMSEDGKETIEHFTAENSPLLSNNITAIATNDENGEVFIGTDGGLVSYQSDAAKSMDNLSEAYAYPNPIRPGFEGVITIAKLSDKSTVKITDTAGNLICTTLSNGGIAIWDGNDAYGKKVRSGIYYAHCNNEAGDEYALVKILFLQ